MASTMQVLFYILITFFVPMSSIVDAFSGSSAQQIKLSNSKEIQSLFHGGQALTRDAVFGLDIDRQHSSDRLAITEVVNRSEFSQITGSINIVAGDQIQDHDIVLLVRMSSISVEALDRLSVRLENKELIVGSESQAESVSSSITLTIIIFIRPHSLQFGLEGTTVSTVNLDITIWPNLDFETYHMSLTAHHGIITGSEVKKFTAHEITIRAMHGDIVGNWSLPSSIRLMTFDGNIDINLIPKQWSSGPFTLGNVHAESTAGDIPIRMPFERNQLSLRNGNTTIQTGSGKISAQLVHGGQTTVLSKGHGSIALTLLPYWTFYEWQGIQYTNLRTEQCGGSMELKILSPIIDTYEPINPLCLMKSHHKTINGDMILRYPRDWCGRAIGSASGSKSHIDVSGKDYEVVIEEPQHVVVQRTPLGSQLNFEVTDGVGHLVLY